MCQRQVLYWNSGGAAGAQGVDLGQMWLDAGLLGGCRRQACALAGCSVKPRPCDRSSPTFVALLFKVLEPVGPHSRAVPLHACKHVHAVHVWQAQEEESVKLGLGRTDMESKPGLCIALLS